MHTRAGIVDVVSRSDDGGRHWRVLATKRQTQCLGGSDPKTADPALAWGRDGYSYFVSNPGHVVNHDPRAVASRVLFYRFGPRGRASGPTSIPAPAGYNDRPLIAADPVHPRRLYASWVFAGRRVMLGRSDDRGRTWKVRTIYTGPGVPPGIWGVQTLPDGHGRLVVVFRNLQGGDWKIESLHSTDGGRTWSSPTTIGTFTPGVTGTPANPNAAGGPIDMAAVGTRGEIEVVWNDNSQDGRGHLYLVRSANGGRSWIRAASIVNLACNTLLPTIAVSARGRIGVSYVAYRQCKSGQKPLADVWFADSSDHGAHWRTTHLAGPFDMHSAILLTSEAGLPGAFIGDYMGLAPTPAGFGSVMILPKPYARSGQQNTFFKEIKTG